MVIYGASSDLVIECSKNLWTLEATAIDMSFTFSECCPDKSIASLTVLTTVCVTIEAPKDGLAISSP